jgi:hypothetical protein
MLELDQILRANELSISLVAAVPALLMSWTLLRGMWTLLLVRAPPDARREAAPCRSVAGDGCRCNISGLLLVDKGINGQR